MLRVCSSPKEAIPATTLAPAPTEVAQSAPTEEVVIPMVAPTPVPPTETPRALRVDVVSDLVGFDDHGWNDAAWRGLVMARDQFGAEINFIEST
ncbi:MAG: hypothetical protein A2Z14_19005 [Chloroflexi bacterium RBG_16_48_8]|nr:MAG: hypothetical protein A2Z14_19005 [Chloroflexi bacterium RBG_16_48_8]